MLNGDMEEPVGPGSQAWLSTPKGGCLIALSLSYFSCKMGIKINIS